MICTAATFVDKATAVRTKDALQRRKFPPVEVYLCGACDKYHFRGTTPNLRIWKTMERVLRLCAMGFNFDTIVDMTGYTRPTVRQCLYDLRQAFGALNLPHLVAIATTIGYLNPNEFIPPVVDKEQCGTP